MNKEIKNYKGITLVALVITVIVLLILAGVSIATLSNKDGLVSNTEMAAEKAKISNIEEKLNFELVQLQLESSVADITIDKYLDKLQQKDIIDESDIEEAEVGSEILVDGEFIFLVYYNNVKEIEIEYLGKVGAIKPSIKLVNISNTTNTITVEVSTKRNEGGKIQYYYKLYTDDKYTLYKETENTTCIYEKLEQNKTYNLKIIAVAQNGQTDEVLVNKETGSVTEIKEGDITFEFDEEEWTNKDVTVTAKTNIDITGFTIQTSKDGSKWDDTASQTFGANGTIYARVVDSDEQYNGLASTNVEKIDKTKPEVTEAIPTTNSIKITATDTASGIIGYTVTENTTQPTSFTECENTKTLNVTVDGKTQGKTYYVWVKDEAGNISVYNKVSTGNVTEIKDGDITFEFDEEEWTNKNVTVTAKSNIDITGFTLQTSKDGSKWDDTASQTFDKNGTIYVRVIDSTEQYNGTASTTVEKIDKLDPNTFTPTATSTINTITVTASTTDQNATTLYGNSGIEGYRFRINGGEWSNYQASGTYTFTGLSQATSYKVEVEAKDNAGNTTPGEVTISTKAVTIGLSATSGYVKAGGTKTITASGSNYGSISVSSSNTNVATVAISGTTITIKGKAAGSATITATATNNTSKKATYTIYVTSLTAPSTTSHTLEVGGTVTLTAPTKSTYAGTITYTSSNTSVATVTSSRVVTAVAGGTATITAREANGGATVTYTIKVNKNQLLANVVTKGQYVNYPVTYSNVSAFCGASSSDTGWRVLYVKDNCVYLVSQSDPLGYWGKTFSSALTTSGLYNWLYTYSNFTGYVNSTYASEARGLLKTDLDTYNGSTLNNGSTYSNNLIKNGTHYYFGNNYLGVTGQVSSSGKITENAELQAFIANPSDGNACIGIRVVVKLNSNVRTTGKNSSGVWQITTSTGN